MRRRCGSTATASTGSSSSIRWRWSWTTSRRATARTGVLPDADRKIRPRAGARAEACRERSMTMVQHNVVSHDEWTQARKRFLAKEKEFTRLRDELSRERRE